MAEIVLIHHSRDRGCANGLKDALGSIATSFEHVDEMMLAGEAKSAIEECKTAVVVWSPLSVRAVSLTQAASEAHRREILCSTTIEGAAPPQALADAPKFDLSGWSQQRAEAARAPTAPVAPPGAAPVMSVTVHYPSRDRPFDVRSAEAYAPARDEAPSPEAARLFAADVNAAPRYFAGFAAAIAACMTVAAGASIGAIVMNGGGEWAPAWPVRAASQAPEKVEEPAREALLPAPAEAALPAAPAAEDEPEPEAAPAAEDDALAFAAWSAPAARGIDTVSRSGPTPAYAPASPPPAPAAPARGEQTAYAEARAADTAAAYRAFLRDYPGGQHAAEARQLQQQRAEAHAEAELKALPASTRRAVEAARRAAWRASLAALRARGESPGYAAGAIADGRRYEGEWENGGANGVGSAQLPNGERYAGAWRDSRRQGYGVLYLGNGHRYEGQFQDDAPTGEGVFWDADGNRLVGTDLFAALVGGARSD